MDDKHLIPGSAEDGLDLSCWPRRCGPMRPKTDVRTFLAALATKREGTLPTQTHIERARDGSFKSTTHVARITVELSGFRYMLSAGKHGGLEA